jgi:hypothetical protein
MPYRRTIAFARLRARELRRSGLPRLLGHLQLQLTGHFQDAAGDYQDTTFKLNDVPSHPLALTHKRFAIFNDYAPAIYQSIASIPGGVYTVSASWYESGARQGPDEHASADLAGHGKIPDLLASTLS